MADIEHLRRMADRVREDWVDAGVAVDRAKERHDELRRTLGSLEREIQAAGGRRIGTDCAYLHGTDVCPWCDYQPSLSVGKDET